jgi:hypothetical protein
MLVDRVRLECKQDEEFSAIVLARLVGVNFVYSRKQELMSRVNN